MSASYTTNEVKNSSGTEVEFVEFERLGRRLVLAQKNEVPLYPHRLTLSHQDVGAGANRRRRTLVRVDISVDDGTGINADPIHGSYQAVLDVPIGRMQDYSLSKNLIAELNSFMSTLGTNTFLYDGTGTGTAAVVAGTLP